MRTLAVLFLFAVGVLFAVGPTPREVKPAAAPIACGCCRAPCPCGPDCQCEECECPSLSSVRHALSCSLMVETPEGRSGSAVVFKGDGCAYAWTDAHVLAKDRKGKSFPDMQLVRNKLFRGRKVGEDRWAAAVIRYSARHDIALLKLRSPWAGGSVRFAGGAPEPGTDVVHVGSMHSTRGLNSVSAGVVAAVGRLRLDGLHDEANGEVYDQVSLIALPGSSGGGVFRKADGLCLGLVTEFLGPGYTPGALCFTPARRLRDWARKHECLHAMGEGKGRDLVGPVVDE